MDRIKAFISYSSEEKRIGGRLKQSLLDLCGYDAFVAHDDIPGSEEWEKRILEAVREADFFILLISQNFKKSDYTDQETGYAISFNKKIIPIKLDIINPYGFISKFQALQYKKNPSAPNRNWFYKYRQDNLIELTSSIAHIGLRYKPTSIYYQRSLHSLVHALCNSGSFDTTNVIIRILSQCNHQFSQEQLKRITRAMATNRQIVEAFGLPELKKILNANYDCHID